MGSPIPFAQGYYESESLPISAQECINFIPSIPETETLTDQSVFGTPGLIGIAMAGNNEFNRGMHVFQGIPYAVNGTSLYRIDRVFDAFGVPNYTAVMVNPGLPILGQERVIMADNGEKGGQICIITPEFNNQFNAYIYTDAGGLVQISDPDFDGPVSGLLYVDGYFMFAKKAGNKYFISNLRDGLSYLATDFNDAEVDTDPIRVPFKVQNEVMIFGSNTFEPNQNIGGSGFPFAPIDGAVQDKGIDSNSAIVELDGDMIWIGSGENEQSSIWISNGGRPQKLSTRAIDNELRKYGDTVISKAFAITYAQSGSFFVAFTFPGKRTFVFDKSSGRWHTRSSQGLKNNWRVSNIVEAYGELIVGDLTTNDFGILDKDSFTEYGNIINRRIVTPPFDNGGTPFFINSLELVGEVGVGNTNDPAMDPRVWMDYSDNGGKMFSTPIDLSFGKIGEYDLRVIWDELGRVPRSRSFGVSCSDPIKWVFFKMEINID